MSRQPPLRRVLALAVLAVSGAVAALASIAPATDAELLLAKTAFPEPVALRLGDAVLPSPARYLREERMQRGDTLAALLERLGVGEADAQRLTRQKEMRQLRAGSTVTAEVRAGGELVWLSFLLPRDVLVMLERVGERIVASEQRAALSTLTSMKSAVVRTSLFAATDAAGVPDSVAMQFADIFGGDIDFHRDLRQGDRFSVLYEVRSLNGRALRAGRILAAEFTGQGKTLRAIRFGDGYYGPDGRNLRKTFLRSPLEFSRVSSAFGLRRHPFLQSWRAHQGVDYAAPSGTRVRAVSDGFVEFAGRGGGYGNMVVLRHPNQISTLYAHLGAIARGVRRGARVAQGEAVGTVGQTGWATGPHLHYEFRVAGAARNPLTLALPAALPVAGHDMAAFRARAQPLAAQLDLLAIGPVAAFE